MFTSQQIGITNNEASVLLENHLEKMRLHQDSLDIPLRSDCTEYKISDLAEDQQQSLAEVLAALRSYCQEQNVNKQKVLRVTVSGVAGSGKSTWINTLVTVVRKMFNNNDTIAVFAPTGASSSLQRRRTNIASRIWGAISYQHNGNQPPKQHILASSFRQHLDHHHR